LNIFDFDPSTLRPFDPSTLRQAQGQTYAKGRTGKSIPVSVHPERDA
jgi:hypothetical protein